MTVELAGRSNSSISPDLNLNPVISTLLLLHILSIRLYIRQLTVKFLDSAQQLPCGYSARGTLNGTIVIPVTASHRYIHLYNGEIVYLVH